MLKSIGRILWKGGRGVGRWVIAAPVSRKREVLYRWTARGIPAGFALWLFSFGPGNLVMPLHAGFRSVSEGNITVYFQDGIAREKVEETLHAAGVARDRDAAFWGEPAGGMRPVSVYLCSSRSRWLQLGLSGDGNALTAGSSILLYPAGMEPRNFAAIVGIEMSHVFASQQLGTLGFFALPRWAEEGLGTELGAPTWSTDAHLKKDLEADPTPALVEMSTLNSRAEWASGYESYPPVTVMYAHARSLVEYLIRQYGVEKFREYLSRASFFKNSNEVFAEVYRMPLAEADEKWLAEFVAAEHPARGAALRAVPVTARAEVTTNLPYLFLSVFGLWVVRQFCKAGRGLAGVVRSAATRFFLG